MSGRTSPIVSPQRSARTSSGHHSDDDNESRLTYSPLSSAGNSPVGKFNRSNVSLSGQSDTDGAPPPYSSPSRSIASNTSSKYSSLMQFLESELGSDNESSVRQGEGAFDDDGVSSMSSQSPTKQTRRSTQAAASSSSSSSQRGVHGGNYGSTNDGNKRSSASQTFLANSGRGGGASSSVAVSRATSGVASVKSSGRSYVWDDWNNLDAGKSTVSNLTDYGDDEATTGDNATYFSLAATARHLSIKGKDESGHPQDGSSPRDGASVGSQSLQRVVGEIKVKVDAMKSELQQLHQGVRDKQSQLTRLATAKAQRIQKFKTLWSGKLTSQRDEQSASIKKTQDFVSRVESDVLQLRSKRDGLKQKQATLSTSSENALLLLRDEVSRRVARARRQWEVEEKAVFEKVLLSKQESIKKAAAESFGPSLDRMVKEGKEAVRARADECYKRLDLIKRELAAELEEKVSQARESMREQIKQESEKSRRVAERRLDETLRKQSEEMDALKSKFAREKKIAEEGAERTRRNDAEVSLEGMREVRRAESQQVVELMAAQQRELGQIVSNHADAVAKLRTQLQAKEADFVVKIQQEMEAEQGSQKERLRSTVLSRANAESEKVIAKLREEITGERKIVRERIEGELNDLRISAQQRLDAMQVSENRAVERAASLRGEIESYKRELAILDEEQSEKASAVSQVRSQLTALRMELSTLKEDAEGTEHRYNQERTRRRTQTAREEERILQDTRAAEEALARQEVASANKREDAGHMYASDLSRIRDKVAALLTKKDAAAKDLRKQLTVLQTRAQELEEQLDENREKWAGSAASVGGNSSASSATTTRGEVTTLEELFQRVGMAPPKGGKQSRTFI